MHKTPLWIGRYCITNHDINFNTGRFLSLQLWKYFLMYTPFKSSPNQLIITINNNNNNNNSTTYMVLSPASATAALCASQWKTSHDKLRYIRVQRSVDTVKKERFSTSRWNQHKCEYGIRGKKVSHFSTFEQVGFQIRVQGLAGAHLQW